MPFQILQRDHGHEPRKQGELFAMEKGSLEATCALWSHPLGWELRLKAAGELRQSQVCRTQNEVFDTFEAWRWAMIENGWK